MVRIPDRLKDWSKNKNSLKKRKIKQYDSVEYQNEPSSYKRRMTFSSPSDPKRPDGKITINSFEDSDPKNPDSFDMVGTLSDRNSFCIGYVDIVKSSKISTVLSKENLFSYYGIFFNSMSKIIDKHHGRVVKSIGDCLLYFFPQSYNGSEKGLKNCLDCGISMSLAQGNISQQSVSKKLPPLEYRISSDFGPVAILRTRISSRVDFIGSTVNLCAKIKNYTPKNEFTIGNDMHRLVKDFKEYKFKELKGFKIGNESHYPIFTLRRKTGFFG